MKTRTKLISEFQKLIDGGFIKDGQEFNGDKGCLLWSGEGTYLKNGDDAFNYWTSSPDYIFGVHKTIEAWASTNGIYFESYDSGTFLAYKI